MGQVGVDASGEVVEDFTVEDLAIAFRSSQGISIGEGAPVGVSQQPAEEQAEPLDEQGSEEVGEGWGADLVADLADVLASDSPEDDALGRLEATAEEVWQEVESLLSQGTEEALLRARQRLPLLLSAQEERGVVLSQMAWVEMQLDERRLGLDYLEAAAREFADSADIESLELLCEKARDIVGEEAFAQSLFNRLLRETRSRVAPVDRLAQVPVLAGLDGGAVEGLDGAAELIDISADAALLREGEPSLNVFFVKRGRLGVRLEAPDGTLKTVANLLPGDLLGESSVLSEEEAYCNATVHTEEDATLWRVEGDEMRRLFRDHPKLKERVSQAREMRRIHSFLSMHPEVGELEATVRERLLGCIDTIVRIEGGAVLAKAGELPPAAYIVINGAVEQRIQDRAIRLFGPDDFIGFRDTLHGIASECEFVILDDTSLVAFDPERLRTLGLESPPNVVAVLERLG